jgi:hypothetical protein
MGHCEYFTLIRRRTVGRAGIIAAAFALGRTAVAALARVGFKRCWPLEEVVKRQTRIWVHRLLARKERTAVVAERKRSDVVVVVVGHAVAKQRCFLLFCAGVRDDEVARQTRVLVLQRLLKISQIAHAHGKLR